MSINDARIYDFDAWIKLAPDFDWDDLHPEPEAPVDPEEPAPGE